MAKPIGFSAFLKLLELSEGPRKSELKKKLGGGGGFQYWRPLHITAPKAILPGANVGLLKAEIASLCSGHQRQYNDNALTMFSRWTAGRALEPGVALPVIDVPFGNSGLSVRLRPTVTFKLDGTLFAMNLWATTRPALTINTLSIGLLFCASAYKAQGHQAHKHVIFDTIKNRLFVEEEILPNSLLLLKDKVDAFKRDWDALSPPSRPSPEGPTDRPNAPR